MAEPPGGIRFLVVMGVSGCGKSTVAKILADRLGWPFIEGDDLHPAANINKMRAGVPLNDADRAPWLQSIAKAIGAWRNAGQPGVVTCSGLRRAYRDIISGGKNDLYFVYLRGSRATIAQRMADRQRHFMPAAMLDSQFAALEEPSPPEQVVIADVALPTEQLVEAILRKLEGIVVGRCPAPAGAERPRTPDN